MLTFLVSIFASLMPARWRGKYLAEWNFNVRAGTLISGALEFLTTAAVLWYRYPAWAAMVSADVHAQVVAKGGGSDKIWQAFAELGAGSMAAMSYIVLPLNVILVYFLIEGLFRLAVVVITGEVIPSLPLQVVEWAMAGGRKAEAAYKLPPLVIDSVERGKGKEWELCIASCRPKEGWNNLMTVSFEDGLYEVVREEQGARERPHVYLLRRAPVHKVVRGFHEYSPDEVLPKKAEAVATPDPGK